MNFLFQIISPKQKPEANHKQLAAKLDEEHILSVTPLRSVI